MNWKVAYLPEAEKDLKDLDGSQRLLVLKAIKKVSINPLPMDEGGYGKPLGNHANTKLAGLLKVKLEMCLDLKRNNRIGAKKMGMMSEAKPTGRQQSAGDQPGAHIPSVSG